MNSGNIKFSDPHKLVLNLADKTDFKRSDKHVALSNISVFTVKTPKSHINTLEIPDGSCCISNIQYYFEYIKKLTDYPPIQIYINKIINRITFKIQTVYYLELLDLKQ